MLPKFGEGQNPFQGPVAEPSGEQTAAAPAPAPVLATASLPVGEKAAAPAVKQPGWFASLTRPLKGWFRRPERASARRIAPQFMKVPVQGELSLDRVRVVRNDLRDSDFEFVKKAPARRPAPADAATVAPERTPATPEARLG
jgi:hypothetical protein